MDYDGLSRRLVEMAAPTDEMRAKVWYHGTRGEDNARSIMNHGLVAPGERGRGHMMPVPGRVYLSSKLPVSLAYTFDGEFESMRTAQNIRDDGKPGFLFVVDGSSLEDVQPDEDFVGEWLHGHSWGDTPDTLGLAEQAIWYYIRNNVTETQFDNIIRGEYSAWASGGKRALKKMPDWMKIHLINEGGTISHGGDLMPSSGWRVFRSQIREIEKDGSNFFEVAERIL